MKENKKNPIEVRKYNAIQVFPSNLCASGSNCHNVWRAWERDLTPRSDVLILDSIHSSKVWRVCLCIVLWPTENLLRTVNIFLTDTTWPLGKFFFTASYTELLGASLTYAITWDDYVTWSLEELKEKHKSYIFKQIQLHMVVHMLKSTLLHTDWTSCEQLGYQAQFGTKRKKTNKS